MEMESSNRSRNNSSCSMSSTRFIIPVIIVTSISISICVTRWGHDAEHDVVAYRHAALLNSTPTADLGISRQVSPIHRATTARQGQGYGQWQPEVMRGQSIFAQHLTNQIEYGASISNPCGEFELSNRDGSPLPSVRGNATDNIDSGDSISNSKITSSPIHPFCANQSIPLLYPETPPACRPNLVLLSSYPTNGNGFVKTTFSVLTNLMTFRAHANKHDKNNIPAIILPSTTLPWVFPSAQYCGATRSLSSPTFPTAGRTALAKTHFGVTFNKQAWLRHKKGLLTDWGRYLSGVVRLVRNPGDQLLRNIARWRNPSGETNNVNKTQFEAIAGRYCGKALEMAKHWNDFHDTWDRFRMKSVSPSSSMSFLILHYETLTDVNGGGVQTFERLLSFVNETAVVDLSRAVTNLIKEPDYIHGELFARHCGIVAARELHLKTRERSKALGYEFDDDTGFWFLDGYRNTTSI